MVFALTANEKMMVHHIFLLVCTGVVFHSTQCALRSFLKIRGLPKVLISSKLPKLYKGKVTHADELKTPIFLEKKKNQKAFVSSSFSFWKFHH
jgi:hypothetical protein